MLRTTILAAALALATAGCLDHTIETTLRPDGTGVRHERMEITRNDDFDLSEQDLIALTRSGPRYGWTRAVEVSADGDTTWVQERTRRVTDLSGWRAPDLALVLLGTTPDRADARLGHVRLGDVRLVSSIQVRSSRRSDGTTELSYREAFVWEGAADAIVEFVLRDVDATLAQRYPRLSEVDRGGILGYARARVWDAGEKGLFFDENVDELTAEAVDRIADYALPVVRVRTPEARREDLVAILESAFAFDDDRTDRLFQDLLPGLNLAFNTSVVYRLTMPGTVTVTNAETSNGSLLEWEFSPLDDLRGPIEIYAESVIR